MKVSKDRSKINRLVCIYKYTSGYQRQYFDYRKGLWTDNPMPKKYNPVGKKLFSDKELKAEIESIQKFLDDYVSTDPGHLKGLRFLQKKEIVF